jgi:AcrR family transcriptional regulator
MFHSRRIDADRGLSTAIVSSPQQVHEGEPFTAAIRLDPRARILDALIATVAYRGYDRTTIERVLQTAEVEGAVFEEHFQDKEDCFLLAMDQLNDRIGARVREHAERANAWPERVRLGLAAVLAVLAEDPEAARVCMVECLSAGQAATERHRTILNSLTSLIDEGSHHAVYPEQLSPHMPEALVGGIGSILHRRVLEERTAELPGLLSDLVYFTLVPYLGHAGALIASAAGVG